jgi:hypothetical protein
MADIFLSYEGTDRQRVAPIAALLESRGWSVWWDQRADPSKAQDAQGRAIERELAACGCVVVAWSVDAVASAAVRREAGRGLARGNLVAVSIDFSRPPPELEQEAPPLAFAGWTGDASSRRAQELLAAIGELLTRPPASLPLAAGPDSPACIRHAASPGPVAADPAPEAADPAPEVDSDPAEIEPGLDLDQEATEPAWATAEAEDEADLRLPPVLLQEAVPRPHSPDAPRTSLARWSLAIGLLAGLAVVAAAAAFWKTGRLGGSGPGVEVAAIKVAPQPAPKLVATPTPASPPKRSEIKPMPVALPPPAATEPAPAALPKALEIEDLLAQVTPRVEELLAGARRLIRTGDIRAAREVLAAPETAHSGLLTFLLAETFDPNVLPAALKGAMADPERARALYRKARELGDHRAQGRLDALSMR